MLFWQLSNIIIYVKIVGKLPKQHLSVWLFSNPGDKILFLLKFNEARILEWNLRKKESCFGRSATPGVFRELCSMCYTWSVSWAPCGSACGRRGPSGRQGSLLWWSQSYHTQWLPSHPPNHHLKQCVSNYVLNMWDLWWTRNYKLDFRRLCK